MSTEADLRAFLLADSDISTAVGGVRIYPLAIPQGGTVPAIVYQRVGTKRTLAHDGPTGLAEPDFQLSVWANTPTAAWDLADLVRELIHGHTGDMDGTAVGVAEVVNDYHDIEEADNISRFRVLLFVRIHHLEAVS